MILRHRSQGPKEPTLIDAIPISMACACKQLYAECLPVLYGENIFRVVAPASRKRNLELPLQHRQLVRHAMSVLKADHRMYRPHGQGLNCYLIIHLWPNIIKGGIDRLGRFPSLVSLTAVLPLVGTRDWVPAVFAAPAIFTDHDKTKERRIALAAEWLHAMCPIDDGRLRACLRLELQARPRASRENDGGSNSAPDEKEDRWDYNEFAEAFELMKRSG
jgi:hypothetical protein